mgnify:FL=1
MKHRITRQLTTRKLADDHPPAHFLRLHNCPWTKCRTHRITHQLDTRKLPDDDPHMQLRWLNPCHETLPFGTVPGPSLHGWNRNPSIQRSSSPVVDTTSDDAKLVSVTVTDSFTSLPALVSSSTTSLVTHNTLITNCQLTCKLTEKINPSKSQGGNEPCKRIHICPSWSWVPSLERLSGQQSGQLLEFQRELERESPLEPPLDPP